MSFLKVAAIIAGVILIVTVIYVASLLIGQAPVTTQAVPVAAPAITACPVIDESITLAEPLKLCGKR